MKPSILVIGIVLGALITAAPARAGHRVVEVTDPDGCALPGARVYVIDEGVRATPHLGPPPDPVSWTDAEGRAEVASGGARESLIVIADGWPPARVLDAPEGVLGVRLAHGGRIEGQVLHHDGRPAAGAQVWASFHARGDEISARWIGRLECETRTDSRGHFAFEGRPLRAQFLFAGLPDALADAQVSPSRDEPARVLLRLSEPVRVEGTVRDERGPVAGARVILPGGAADDELLAITTADGSYRGRTLHVHEAGHVRIESEGHVPVGINATDRAQLDVLLPIAGRIEFTFDSDLGVGQLTCLDADVWQWIRHDLRILAEGVFPGRVACTATGTRGDAGPVDVEVRAGETPHVRLEVRKVPHVRLHVVSSADGTPISGALACHQEADAEGWIEARLSECEPPGRVHAAGYRGVPMVAESGEHELLMEPLGTWTGLVTSNGAPVAGARLHPSWSNEVVVSDADGTFVLGAFDVDPLPEPAEHEDFLALAMGFHPSILANREVSGIFEQGWISVPPAPGEQLLVELEVLDSSPLRLQLVHDGLQLPRATVRLESEGFVRVVTSDEQGMVVLAGWPEGETEIGVVTADHLSWSTSFEHDGELPDGEALIVRQENEED